MAALLFPRLLARAITSAMNTAITTWRKRLSRLTYLPVLVPCSTSYSKLRAGDGTIDGQTSTEEEQVPAYGSHGAFPIQHTADDGMTIGQNYSVAQQLPYEILVQIFLDVGEDLRKERGGPFFGDQCYAHPAFRMVSLSHVCYRWRSVALDQSEFWARNVTSFSRAPREELVRRARGLPIDALLHVSRNQRPFEDPDFGFIHAHIRAFRSLSLWLPEFALPAFGLVLPALDTQPLNVLESLEVTLYDAHPGVRMQEFRALPPLCTPSLHTAIFRDCFLFLEAPNLVTHLEIIFRRCYRANTEGALLTPAELSAVLTSCTSLRHLRLGDELPLFKAGAAPIALPHLERLAIEGSSGRCARLLEVLDFPKAASVRVRGHNVPSPSTLEDPLPRTNILRAVEVLHTRECTATTTLRVFPGMSFELMRERSRVRGEGVHIAFEHFERGPPIIEVLQMFALAQVPVRSLQADNDTALDGLCMLLKPTDDVADGAEEISFPDLETIQLSGTSTRFVLECAAGLLAVQERRCQLERPLHALILSYPCPEWALIEETPAIQSLQRLLFIQYTDATAYAASLPS
ncbi:unnamed protein product [Peniophora sp. CBMAI 1063]|nr:unnamed protein product [Peniophora sp. CBMAI 1063]